MDTFDLATKWRLEHDYTGKGGVIVIHDGVVNSWVNELRDPGHWQPGCIACDESGKLWVAAGGNASSGAERWDPVE
jgi:hypothetical protein